jgi:hypothetical protein
MSEHGEQTMTNLTGSKKKISTARFLLDYSGKSHQFDDWQRENPKAFILNTAIVAEVKTEVTGGGRSKCWLWNEYKHFSTKSFFRTVFVHRIHG